MQACLENAPVTLAESSSLPLLESTSLPLLDSAPAWTIRFARPVVTGRNEFAQELRGVPKAALRQVFGKLLGTRLWLQNRPAAMPAAANSKPAPAMAIPTRLPSAPIANSTLVSDAEIRNGMLSYLCKEAAETLQERQRLAKSISLTAQYSDGESETSHQLLLRSTNEPNTLEAAARAAIRGLRSSAFVSLKLDVAATAATPA